MFLLIYNIVIRAYHAIIQVASIWNPKARLWVAGRKDLLERVEREMKGNTLPVVWMHSSSLGEFEQGRTLIENIRNTYSPVCIVISFFSPSGYEVMKNYKGADHIFYLPVPTRRNARRFINAINPSMALWIKYDYWYHYLAELKRRNIPVLLISAIFHRHHPFFRWYGPLYKEMLRCFTWMFVQTPESAKRLDSIGFRTNVSVNGDTRFDRVIDIAENFHRLAIIENFCGGSKVVVAGSTWPEDEEELDHYANIHPEIRFVIAPHEIDEEHLQDIEKLFRSCVRYSALDADKIPADVNTLIIDNIGMLSKLYHYATVAYVGGGFGNDGVHNVLEAAVHRKPVIFGPVFDKFREAIGLLEEGGAFTIGNALELEKTLDDLLSDEKLYQESSRAAGKFVYDNRGATRNIMQYIQAKRLLIS